MKPTTKKGYIITVVVAIISIGVTTIVTIVVSRFNFAGWQRKVAIEALENTKLEQEFCDKAIMIANDKIEKIKQAKDLDKNIVLEYFNNLKNQLVSLRATINKSKLTWKNIFPEQAKNVAELDKTLVEFTIDVNDFRQQLESLKEGKAEVKLNQKTIEKLEKTVKALKSKVNLVETQLSEYKNSGFIYPSSVIASYDSADLLTMPIEGVGNLTTFNNDALPTSLSGFKNTIVDLEKKLDELKTSTTIDINIPADGGLNNFGLEKETN